MIAQQLHLWAACDRDVIDVDLFAGGGGMSAAMREVHGVSPAIALNHCPLAIRTHAINHPDCQHHCCGVQELPPRSVVGDRHVRHLHASPDCTHHSRASGGRPVSRNRRALANHVLRWARDARPDVITMENVEEFLDWGPLLQSKRPDPARKGQEFQRWLCRLKGHGYVVDWRVLKACDYGAPTTRRRLFIVARCDGLPIRWPAPTHGPGTAQPYRTAAECIDWSLPCPSIFDRPRPLAEKTLRRIARGIVRYVLEDPQPFIVTIDQQSNPNGCAPVDQPLGTVTTKARHALIAPFVAKHYGGVTGHRVDRPLGSITTVDHHSLVSVTLRQADREVVMDHEDRQHQVAAFLMQYYSSGGQDQRADRPLHTITTRARHALVQVPIDNGVLADVGMRMFQPHELAQAQGFPPDYQLPKVKRDAIRLIGNSVPPQMGAAVVRAQFYNQPKGGQ